MLVAETDLPSDVEALQLLVVERNREIEAHERKHEEHERHIAILEEFIRLQKQKQFGTSSEKGSKYQLGLFNEAEEDRFEAESAEEEELTSSQTSVPGQVRRKPGRRPLPTYLPRREIVHDLADEELVCAHDGTRLVRIGEEVSEQLEIIPVKIEVLRHVRPKYACPSCKRGVKTAMLPPQPIPKSMASPGLLAYVAASKYLDGLPLYRVERVLQRGDVDIPRATLASWMIKCGQLVQPLINLLRDELLSGDIVLCDETRVQVLDEVGRPAASQSYVWVQQSGEGSPAVTFFDYDPSRSAEVPKRLLEGFEGYLHTDGYAGYDGVVAENEIIYVGCWAHTRRKFDEAHKAQQRSSKKKRTAKGSTATQALTFIRKLYAIEKQIANKPPDERRRIRQEQSKPIIDKMREWLDGVSGTVPPKSLVGKALGYLENQWPKLVHYLDDGRLRMDTNLVENAIRPFVIGRKAWLFSKSVRGAEASANLYGLIETARMNGLEPYAYLQRVFEQLPAAESVEDFEALLPWRIEMAESTATQN